jgi:chloride channel protein, CIC family
MSSTVADANRGDFTADSRVLVVTLMAVFVGVASAFVALALQRLIGFFTNLFYYQRFSISEFISPAGHHLGVWAVFIPIMGGLIVGLMARYGSERIRGHGIPGAGSDPHRSQPHGSARRRAEAAFIGPLDRRGSGIVET